MTVRLASFSSGSASASASVSTSAHTGDECFVPDAQDPLLAELARDTGSANSRCATEATDCTDATWKEQAHWLSFRDSVHRIQNQLVNNTSTTNSGVGSPRRRRIGAPIQKNKIGTFSTLTNTRTTSRGAHTRITSRPPKAPHSGPFPYHQRPPLHHALNNALRSPSPQEIERDLQLYRYEDEQTSPSRSTGGRRRGRRGDLDDRAMYLSNCSTITESPSRENNSTAAHSHMASHLGGIRAIPETDEEDDDIVKNESSEDSLDDLVQSLLPSNTGGLADPPTTFHSLNNDAEVADIPVPTSVDADPRNRLLVEPSPLRPHHHQCVGDDEEDGKRLGGTSDVPTDGGAKGGIIKKGGTGALVEGDDGQQTTNRRLSSSPHPSVHSAHSHSSSSYSRSHSSYSTGTSSSYGSSFDPELLAEETRQRALESHLAEAQLKLALVEAERDEMEFELLQRKRK